MKQHLLFRMGIDNDLPFPVRYYTNFAIVAEISFGVAASVLSALVIFAYIKLKGWRKPASLIFMNLLMIDFINGLNGPLQAAYVDELVKKKTNKTLFRTVFFIQALVLWVSLWVIFLLNLTRLIAIVLPFRYNVIVTTQAVSWALAAVWATGFINCFLKRFVYALAEFKYYVAGVMIHLILDVMIFGLSLYTIAALRNQGQASPDRVNATKTVVVVSLVFSFTYGYYVYVNLVWMVPHLCYRTTNPWLQLTACGKWSLSLAHILLLFNSCFNGLCIANQPRIKRMFGLMFARGDEGKRLLLNARQEIS